MNTEHAGCHCGNIAVQITLTKDLPGYTPRACDCDFCIKNGAAYLSDPDGQMNITITKSDDISFYRQGDNLVELIICKVCGVLVAVTYSEGEKKYGGLNSRSLVNRERLSAAVAASPKLLSVDEKIERWKQLWFSDVTIK